MPGDDERANQGAKRPSGGRSTPRKTGGLHLRRIGGDDFEIAHPRCVHAMEPDYEEGIELWRAGDPEAARDALRYALQGCGDNLWVHVALGNIALDEFNDPSLARGHFGYAFELAQRAIVSGFRGRLPRERVSNRPFYEAIDGLARCYEALGNLVEVKNLRDFAARLADGRSEGNSRSEGDRPVAPRGVGRKPGRS